MCKKIIDEKVVIIGDSLLAWNDFFQTKKDVRNLSVPGYTSMNILFQLSKIDIKSDILITMFGVNDLIYNLNDDYLKDNYEKFFKSLPNSISKKFFISLLPTDSLKLNNRIIKFNNYLSSREDIIFIDVFSLFEINGCINKNYTTDGIHLNSYGYDILNNELKILFEREVK